MQKALKDTFFLFCLLGIEVVLLPLTLLKLARLVILLVSIVLPVVSAPVLPIQVFSPNLAKIMAERAGPLLWAVLDGMSEAFWITALAIALIILAAGVVALLGWCRRSD